jgi:hypothetical protein
MISDCDPAPNAMPAQRFASIATMLQTAACCLCSLFRVPLSLYITLKKTTTSWVGEKKKPTPPQVGYYNVHNAPAWWLRSHG